MSRSRPPTDWTSRGGTARRRTEPQCSWCTAEAATGPARWRTPRCSCVTDTACWSTTRADAGESDGAPNNYGWDWGKDVAGALTFLERRGDVEPDRIGALGLSTGADVLIEVAAKRQDLGAVVSDGAAAGSFEDWHRLRGTEIGLPVGWVMFTTMRVLSGDPPGPPLEDLIRRIQAPTLLISAGVTEEREFNVLYEKAGRGRVEHWNLPEAHHTAAIREERAQYERRVVGFLDDALRR
jgi:uncharacterized protein